MASEEINESARANEVALFSGVRTLVSSLLFVKAATPKPYMERWRVETPKSGHLQQLRQTEEVHVGDTYKAVELHESGMLRVAERSISEPGPGQVMSPISQEIKQHPRGFLG